MKFNLGNIPIKINIVALIRLYRYVKRLIKRKRLKIKVIKNGCPKCKGDVEISGPFQICVNFGKNCNYIIIKGIKTNQKEEVKDVQRLV